MLECASCESVIMKEEASVPTKLVSSLGSLQHTQQTFPLVAEGAQRTGPSLGCFHSRVSSSCQYYSNKKSHISIWVTMFQDGAAQGLTNYRCGTIWAEFWLRLYLGQEQAQTQVGCHIFASVKVLVCANNLSNNPLPCPLSLPYAGKVNLGAEFPGPWHLCPVIRS